MDEEGSVPGRAMRDRPAGEETTGSPLDWREGSDGQRGGHKKHRGGWRTLHPLSHLENWGGYSQLPALSVTLGKCMFGGSASPPPGAPRVSSQTSPSPWTLIQSRTDGSGRDGEGASGTGSPWLEFFLIPPCPLSLKQ